MIEQKRGRLIVFEGVEGAGKSTQLQRLAGHLARAGVAHRMFREPGGTVLGDAIRTLLLDPRSTISARAEALLFMASRAQLIAEVIQPALAQGELVLADRFFLSTYAYQVVGRGLSLDDVRAGNRLATGELVPDLTVLLTLPAAIRDARTRARGSADRIEGAGNAFHDRVERAFAECASPAWQAAHPECGAIMAVNAEGAEREVLDRVIGVLVSRMPEQFPMLNAAHA